jgi:predicted nicotinamide N-methyase
VTAVDWAADAIELLERNAARNRLPVRAERRDWREPWGERFELAIAADVLYERRNVDPVLARLRELAPQALVCLAGRPYEQAFLRAAGAVEEVAPRVVRFSP